MIVNIDKLTYLLDDNKKCATVTKSLVPYSGEVVIPDVVQHNGVEYPVTDILDEAFAECVGLHSVVLGENVESIGIGAFEGCTALSTIKGESGSYAEEYAKNNGMYFKEKDF